MFAIVAAMSAADAANPKRIVNAGFWGLYATSFLAGDFLGDFGNGILVLAMAGLAAYPGLGIGSPKTTSPEERRLLARKYGNLLFVPSLAIPLVTLAGSFALKSVPFVDPAQATLLSLALGAGAGLILARVFLHQRITDALQEGRRLMDTIGWAALLPQMLAALGAVFALSGVGRAVNEIASISIPEGSRFAAVAAYCVGMAVFTAVMGNAFAAFPVLTAGIGLPLIVMKFGGNPSIMAAIGMLAGFCGTLSTPMAANFNLVPVALLGLKDRYAIIKVQLPTAGLLLAVNTVLMYVLVFRF
jgi:uncharacterized membrane protein